jgi:hypothetical protein
LIASRTGGGNRMQQQSGRAEVVGRAGGGCARRSRVLMWPVCERAGGPSSPAGWAWGRPAGAARNRFRLH